jgi:hypothetical protein
MMMLLLLLLSSSLLMMMMMMMMMMMTMTLLPRLVTLTPPCLCVFLQALERVRQGADMMPKGQLEGQLARELGADWRERLQHFDDKPMAAASIGQVGAFGRRGGLSLGGGVWGTEALVTRRGGVALAA